MAEDQAALVRYAVSTPCDSESRHRRYPDAHGRRYGIGAAASKEIRDRVVSATMEALTHMESSPEHVAQCVALAAERAIFAVGVERLDA